MDEHSPSPWFRGGRRTASPEGELVTRTELQRRLRERITAGDTKAAAVWERWKYVDRLFDAFRDNPLYAEDRHSSNPIKTEE